MLDTSKFASVDDYYRMLKRDDRATFNKIPMVFERNGITVKSAVCEEQRGRGEGEGGERDRRKMRRREKYKEEGLIKTSC